MSGRGLAILCPGQGVQHPAMLELAVTSRRGAEAVAAASAALGQDVAALIRAGGPPLFRNATAQPLLCAAELATWAAIRDALPRPVAFAGYSLGELAAYACAGALGAPETVALAAARAGLMDAAAEQASGGGASGMVGVRGLRVAAAEALAAECGAEIAIVNGADHCIVGGRVDGLSRFAERAIAAGATKAERLPISVAAHTTALASAVAPFTAALGRTALRDPEIPVIAGITAAPVRTRAEALDTLSRQLATRIEWARCLTAAAELGCGVFLELGPGGALAKMAGELVPDAAARSLDDFRTIEGAARWVERAVSAS